MPDFGSMLRQSKQSGWDDEKVYDTLFEELEEKCNPKRFLGEEKFDEGLFGTANRIYSELQKKKGEPDEKLIDLRNQAMKELGIHISTKKKYDYLIQYLSPEVYADMQPYDGERVAESGKWYALLLQRKNDIIALEQLELLAADFIGRKKNEEEEAWQKWEQDLAGGGADGGDVGLIHGIILLGMLFFIIALIVLAIENQ